MIHGSTHSWSVVLFLGFQVANFFAQEIDVSQVTHGVDSTSQVDSALMDLKRNAANVN
jgi:hypothetical protein